MAFPWATNLVPLIASRSGWTVFERHGTPLEAFAVAVIANAAAAAAAIQVISAAIKVKHGLALGSSAPTAAAARTNAA